MSIWNLIFKAFQEKWPKFSQASNHIVAVATLHQIHIQLWEWKFVWRYIYQSILCAETWSWKDWDNKCRSSTLQTSNSFPLTENWTQIHLIKTNQKSIHRQRKEKSSFAHLRLWRGTKTVWFWVPYSIYIFLIAYTGQIIYTINEGCITGLDCLVSIRDYLHDFPSCLLMS